MGNCETVKKQDKLVPPIQAYISPIESNKANITTQEPISANPQTINTYDINGNQNDKSNYINYITNNRNK